MRSRLAGLLLGVLLGGFGLACLNYTRGETWDHHVAWAKEKGMPEPSHAIFLAGAGCTVLGSGITGLVLGRRRGS